VNTTDTYIATAPPHCNPLYHPLLGKGEGVRLDAPKGYQMAVVMVIIHFRDSNPKWGRIFAELKICADLNL